MYAREATLSCSGLLFLTLMLVKVSSESIDDNNLLVFSNNDQCSTLKQALNGVEMAISIFQVKYKIKKDKQ